MSLTVAERLENEAERLTPAETRLAATLAANYPFAGLETAPRLAEAAGVSAPSVTRLAQKLGFGGFPAMQAALRAELEARVSGPIAKRELWADAAPGDHVLNRYAEAAIADIRQTLAAIDVAAFDAAADLLADPKRAVFVAGGRITRTLAEYLHLHFEMLRPGVRLLPHSPAGWAHQVIDIRPGDALVLFDVRRYEPAALRLAKAAKAQGAEIVLFTDQWRSPAARLAAHVFAVRIEAPSAWDTATPTLLLVESLVAATQDRGWRRTKRRIEALERLFGETGLFGPAP